MMTINHQNDPEKSRSLGWLSEELVESSELGRIREGRRGREEGGYALRMHRELNA